MVSFDLNKENKTNKQTVLLTILTLLLLTAAISTGYFFWKFRQTQKQLLVLSSMEGQKEIAKKDTDELLAKLKKLIVVPENEEPVVATVTDSESLAKDQPFYANASNGDRVIAFLKNRKAIIYSPAKNIIINVGPIYGDTDATGNTASSTSPTQQEQPDTVPTTPPTSNLASTTVQ